MSKLFITAAIAFAFAAPAAMANGNNGNGPPSAYELAKRICGNNGEGNGAEILKWTYKGLICKKKIDIPYFEPDEDFRKDVDPN